MQKEFGRGRSWGITWHSKNYWKNIVYERFNVLAIVQTPDCEVIKGFANWLVGIWSWFVAKESSVGTQDEISFPPVFYVFPYEFGES